MAVISMQSICAQYLSNYAHSIPDYKKELKKYEESPTSHALNMLNRNMPNYIQDFSDKNCDFALFLKDSCLHFMNQLEPFLSKDQVSMLQSAKSSNPSIADVSCLHQTSLKDFSSFTLEVDNLALPQINESFSLLSNAQTLPCGEYTLSIQVDRIPYSFQFDIEKEEANHAIFHKLSNMITNALIGIDAQVSQFSSENASYSVLTLTSRQTGVSPNADVIFSLSGNLSSNPADPVTALGLDYVKQFPENAHYQINQTPMEAKENSFTYLNNFSIQLKKPSTQPLEISLEADPRLAKTFLDNFVSSYNSLLSGIQNNFPNHTYFNQFVSSLKSSVSHFQDSLSKLGIQTLEDDMLSFDDSIFTNDSESLQDFSRLIEILGTKASYVILDPLKFSVTAIAIYKNIQKDNFPLPYVSSIYSGLYFNSYA